MNKSQRKQLLLEQLKYIKKELGMEQDEKSTMIAKFKERLTDTVPEHAKKVIEDELVCLFHTFFFFSFFITLLSFF
jgi:Lon-like ATP-dependent protease